MEKDMTDELEFLEAMRRSPASIVKAWDPVNAPMVRQWCEVIGIDNPLYLDEAAAQRGPHGALVAPAAMLHSWTMPGYLNQYSSGEEMNNQHGFEANGFPGVVATNFQYIYDRYPHMGELLTRSSTLANISDLKKTKLGEGYFMTQSDVYTGDGGRRVGEVRLSAFFFRPSQTDDKSQSKPAQKNEPPKEESIGSPVVVDVTTGFIVASAIATRDYQPVHHDRDAAQSGGTKDIYLNILATAGLVQRCVEEWYGPNVVLESLELRLLSQAYPGDQLTFTQQSSTTSDDGRVNITLRGNLRDSVFAQASVTARIDPLT